MTNLEKINELTNRNDGLEPMAVGMLITEISDDFDIVMHELEFQKYVSKFFEMRNFLQAEAEE